MPVDHNAPLSTEVKETVRRRIAELTEELKTRFDVGFRSGVYILYTVDAAELPDGLWVLFPTMPAELAYGFMEAGYKTMRKFIDSGIIERLKILHEYEKTHPQPPNSNSDPNRIQPQEEQSVSNHQ
jgi:hypothetical protein